MRTRHLITAIVLIIFITAFSPGFASGLKTACEQSNFTKQTGYDATIGYLEDLQKESPCVRILYYGKSLLGRRLPLVIITDPPINSPREILTSDKPTILITSQIHGNEPAGKEANLIILRRLATGDLSYLTKNLNIISAPILNPDGCADFVRRSALNLDMNRDYMKLDTREIKSLLKNVVYRYQPHVCIDLHEAGSRPNYQMLYESCRNPGAPEKLIEISENEIVPGIIRALDNAGIKSHRYFVYKDNKKPEEGIESGKTSPRTGRNFMGMEDRLSFLFESVYPPKDAENSEMERRVKGHIICVEEVLKYAGENSKKIYEAVTGAWAGNPPGENTVILKTKLKETSPSITYYAYETQVIEDPENDQEQAVKTKKIVTLHGPWYADPEAVLTTKLPYAYILPPCMKDAAKAALDHGFSVEKISRDVTLEVTGYKLEKLSPQKEMNQGRYFLILNVMPEALRQDFPRGSFIIRCNRPSGKLISIMLEPESPDSLFSAGDFASMLKKGDNLPVYRLESPINIAAELLLPEDSPENLETVGK
ncbi:MAG: hypothetical protein M1269_08200 [Chloroflexi bacterium]|nr:hypothetical protein [Chloroflexota bacterium]